MSHAVLSCLHSQDQESLVARKKRRGTTRVQNRGIAGASLEVRHAACLEAGSQPLLRGNISRCLSGASSVVCARDRSFWELTMKACATEAVL